MKTICARDFGERLWENRRSVIEAFVERSRLRIPATRGLSHAQIEDHLDGVLHELAEYLRTDGSRREFLKTAWLANKHGLQRAERREYSLEDLQHEYLILREVLMEVLPPSHTLDARAITLFSEVFLLTSNKGTENFVRNSVSELLEHQRQFGSLKEQRDAIEVERSNFENFVREVPELVAMLSGDSHRFEFLNQSFIAFLKTDVTGQTLRDVLPDAHPLHEAFDKVYKTGQTVSVDELAIKHLGRTSYFNFTMTAKRDAANLILGVMVLGFDVTDQVLTRESAKLQRRALELTVANGPLNEILDCLARMVELQAGNGQLASILLVDRERKYFLHGAAPSLPNEFNEAVNGLSVGPLVGPSGAAVATKERVVVEDIAADSRWVDFKSLALRFGLRACWSTPIINQNGDVLATFAIYTKTPSVPTAREVQIVEIAAGTVNLILSSRRANEKAREKDADFRFVLSSTGVSTWDIDFERGGNLILSEGAAGLSGQNEFAQADDLIETRVHPEDRARVREIFSEALRSPNEYRAEFRILLPGGKVGWIDSRGRTLHDATGKLRRFSGIEIDVTERRHIDEALAQANNQVQDALSRLENTLKIMPIGVALLDGPDHVYSFTNAAHDRLLGGQELIGRTVREAVPEAEDQGLIRLMDEVYRTGQPFETEARELLFVQRDGKQKKFYLRFSYQPLRRPGGEIYGIAVTVVDISELTLTRHQAIENAERAKNAEMLLQKAVDVAGIGFFDWDMQNDIFLLSDQFARDWGVQSGAGFEELFSLIVPEDREPTKKLMEKAADGLTYRAQYRIRRRTDGAVLWIDAQGRITKDEHGRPHKFFGTSINISERKAFESETLAMVNSIPQLAWMADSAGHLFWYNQRWQDFTGADQSEMASLGWAPFHHPDFVERASKKWFEHLAAGKRWEDIFPLRGKDGEYRMFLSRAEPIRDLQGKIVRWFGTNTDITEPLSTEKDLARMAAVVESSGDFVAISDPKLKPISLNPGGRKMVGLGAREISDFDLIGCFATEKRDFVRERVVPTLFAQGIWQGELDFEHFETGARIPINCTFFPIKDKAGELLGYATIAQDITERKRLENSLRDSRDDAEQANQAKSVFLANMSHEIRTPLGAIMGFSDLAKQPGTPVDEVKNYLSVVERNSVQVLRIIDDILDLAKVEAGRVELERMEFSLVEFVADFSSLMGFRARENGIHFMVTAETDLPNVVLADATRLRQILTNAVGNAIKFTTRGSVLLNIAAEGKCLTFRVIDTGRGISPEQSRNLFQAFVQADVSTTRKYGGTGLGLVLTRRLCQLMGGDYVLERSEFGVGSTFVATVRVEIPPGGRLISRGEVSFRATGSANLVSMQNRLKNVSVLLVEDSLDNQQLVQLLLGRQGAKVEVASDGREGVSRALEESYDVVLMDIQMPVMDGHEAVQKLRASGYTKPVIALTAHAMKEEMERAQRSGFTSFLTKPIQREALITMVGELGTYRSAPEFNS